MTFAARHCVAAATLCVLSSPLVAQASTDSTQRVELPPVAAWATLSLGLGYASNRTRLRLLGAQAGAFGSYGPWVAGYRRGGATGIESGGAYDDALLFGHRFAGVNSTAYVAIGPTKVYDESSGLGNVGIGFSSEAGGNVRLIGIGVSAFGSFAPHRGYVGVGLTLDAGWIR
jgi:hypothetical protein